MLGVADGITDGVAEMSKVAGAALRGLRGQLCCRLLRPGPEHLLRIVRTRRLAPEHTPTPTSQAKFLMLRHASSSVPLWQAVSLWLTIFIRDVFCTSPS